MRKCFIAISVLGAVLLSGCGTIRLGAGAVPPTGIYTDTTYPSIREVSTVRLDLTSADFTVLGTVSGVGESKSYFMMISSGDNGWGTLMQEAKIKYPDFDTIINVVWDTQYKVVLPFYQRVRSKVSGVAIKYNNKAK